MAKFATLFPYTDLGLTQNEFENLIDNLELNLKSLCRNNPLLIVLIGDLNAKSKNWYSHDKIVTKEMKSKM